jgi:hypothetical protein
MKFSPGKLLKNLGLRVGGALGALSLVFVLAVTGNRFYIGFMQSQGGLLISVIMLGEAVFFILILA